MTNLNEILRIELERLKKECDQEKAAKPFGAYCWDCDNGIVYRFATQQERDEWVRTTPHYWDVWDDLEQGENE